MAITELALLRLKEAEPSAITKNDLQAAQEGQSDYSGHPVRFLRSVEDQLDFFLVGGWESVDQHRGEWITSEMNQRLLGKLKDAIDVHWMFHLDIDVSISLEANICRILKKYNTNVVLAHGPNPVLSTRHRSSEVFYRAGK